MLHSAQDQGWKGSLHLVPSLSPLCAEIKAHAITSAVVERQEQRTKTPYSLDINLITTRLNIAANRYVVNRFPKSLSKCPLNTSWCAASRRAQVHVLTYQLESLTLLVIWSTLSIQKEWIWRNMQRLAAPLAHLSLIPKLYLRLLWLF